MGLSSKQLGMIHGSAKQARLNEQQYRMVLRSVGRVESSKDLDQRGFEDVMAAIEAASGSGRTYWQEKVDRRSTTVNSRMVWLIRDLYGKFNARAARHYELGGLVMRFSSGRTAEPEEMTPREAWTLIEMLKAKIGTPQEQREPISAATNRSSQAPRLTLFGVEEQEAVPETAGVAAPLCHAHASPHIPITADEIPF